MKLSDLLPIENIAINVAGNSKKRVLEKLSIFLSERIDGVKSDELYHGLIARERLGSTGLGDGVAIPHCRLAACKNITAIFFRLNSSVDFDATDNTLVDLVFALIVPEEQDEEHLNALSTIAELLQSKKNCAALRDAKSNKMLYQALMHGEG
jgi:PTS system nitrogen regulatory IIA component